MTETIQLVLMDALEKHPSVYPDPRLSHAVALLPPYWFLSYILAALFHRFLVPTSVKNRLRILTQDSVTLDNLPEEPTPRMVVRWKAVLSTVLAAARLAMAVVLLVRLQTTHTDRDVLTLIQRSLAVSAWTIATIYLLLRPSVTPVYGMLLFYILDILAVAYSLLVTSSFHPASPSTILDAACSLLSISLVLITASLPTTSHAVSANMATRKDTPTCSLDSPEDNTSLSSWLRVSWMAPLLSIAYKRTLNDSDVWQLSPFFQTANIYPVFKRILGETERPSLLWRITKFTAFDLVVTTLCSLVIAFFSFSFPYFLKKILEALTSTDSDLRARAYHLALLAFVVNVLQQLVELIRAWHSRRSYERVRGVLITMVFEKATRKKDTSGSVGHRKLDKDEEEASGSDSGRIMNLMNGDAYAVGQWFWEVSLIVRAPIELTVALIFLYQILGWSSLVGLSAVSVAIIVLKYLVDRNLALTRGMLAATDRRISVISELVSSIRLLKYYAWESIWVDKAVEAREKELAIRYKSNFNGAWIYFVMTITPRIINFLAFLSYTKLAHKDLTIPVAFAGIAVFNIVQMHLATLPGRVMFLLRTLISIRRLDKYLGEEEIERAAAGSIVPQTGLHSARLGFEASTFQYPQHEVRDESAETFRLVCPTFDFPLGRLTLVAGDNAGGKSSLLMALLGEMDCVSGRLYRPTNKHAFAIVTQDSWSEQATILDNVLFGAPYDEKRFDEVVEACALGPDLAAWEGREHTEVGERGISLSGGQRARVALARAVYSSASVLLLDDPLSAVDAHTARHLVEKCFGGALLKDRTVILVTHHIKLCTPVASLIVRMTAGTASLQNVDLTKPVSETSSLHDDTEDDTAVATPSGNKIASGASTPASRASPAGGLITKENRAEGSVKWKVYGMYLRAAGIETWVGILVTLLAARALEVGQQWLLKAWGESYNATAALSLSIHDLLPPASENVNPWLGVYLGVAFLNAFVVLVRLAFSYHGSFKAARSLLYACLSRVTNAQSRWLDQNPTGRLLNRFTADISAVDSTVNNSITDVLSQGIGFIASLLAVVYVVPRFLIFALFAIVLYTIMGTPYVRCSRDLRRLENNHRSPLFSRFGGLLRGLKVVRAFGQEQRYLKMLMTELDLFQAMDHFFWTARFYLALRFDVLGSLAIYVVTLAALGGAVSQGDAAFAIVLTYQFVGGLHETFYSYAKLELDVNSIERIHDLLSTPQEPPAVIEKNRPPAHWPASGEITIDNLAVRYAPHLPPALNGISAYIRPGEKIGIVGRTGSGKTTLALSLLRITDPYAGSITIDGLDIAQMGLRDLRERVTIISQESTLFEGTIRSNLDPRSEHTDADLCDVLRRVGMARSTESREEDAARLIKSLDAPVTTGAENFSQGERQLISIARALLRRSNVFIADEATASVDFDTDERVQRTLRQELAHCTVLTIAHRLRTVIDVDRVLLLQNGVVIEFDAPKKLLADETSAFRELCAQSNELEELIRLAGIE